MYTFITDFLTWHEVHLKSKQLISAIVNYIKKDYKVWKDYLMFARQFTAGGLNMELAAGRRQILKRHKQAE